MSATAAQWQEVFWLAPIVLLVGSVGLCARFLRRQPDRTVSRVALAALGAQVVVGLAAWLVVLAGSNDSGSDGSCHAGGAFGAWVLSLLGWIVVLLVGPAVAAGVVLGNRDVWLWRALATVVLALALATVPFLALTRAILCAIGS